MRQSLLAVAKAFASERWEKARGAGDISGPLRRTSSEGGLDLRVRCGATWCRCRVDVRPVTRRADAATRPAEQARPPMKPAQGLKQRPSWCRPVWSGRSRPILRFHTPQGPASSGAAHWRGHRCPRNRRCSIWKVQERDVAAEVAPGLWCFQRRTGCRRARTPAAPANDRTPSFERGEGAGEALSSEMATDYCSQARPQPETGNGGTAVRLIPVRTGRCSRTPRTVAWPEASLRGYERFGSSNVCQKSEGHLTVAFVVFRRARSDPR